MDGRAGGYKTILYTTLYFVTVVRNFKFYFYFIKFQEFFTEIYKIKAVLIADDSTIFWRKCAFPELNLGIGSEKYDNSLLIHPINKVKSKSREIVLKL